MGQKVLLCALVLALACNQLFAAALESQASEELEERPTTTPPAAAQPVTTPATTTSTTTTTPAPKTSSTTTTLKPSSKPVPCVQNCTCTQTRMDCSSRGLFEVPKLSKVVSSIVEFSFANNSLSAVDLKQFPMASVSSLNFSRNRISSLAGPTKKQNELNNLLSLDLSQNELSSLAMLGQYKMPELETLNLARNRLSSINATDLNQMGSLRELNLSQALRTKLPDLVLAKLTNLDELDLSGNDLVDVPEALRAAPSITRLLLNRNSMTSLRPSDLLEKEALKHLEISACSQLMRIDSLAFGKLPALETLVITDNKRLSELAADSFHTFDANGLKVAGQHEALRSVDLRNNNLQVVPAELQQLKAPLRLAGNPLDCSCQLHWLLNATRQIGAQPLHCASPSKYKDLEVSQVLATFSCQPEESMMQRFVLVVFLLFLVVLTVAVFVQRADICRRLQWRDQYGTIYYTKARFPTEQV